MNQTYMYVENRLITSLLKHVLTYAKCRVYSVISIRTRIFRNFITRPCISTLMEGFFKKKKFRPSLKVLIVHRKVHGHFTDRVIKVSYPTYENVHTN